MMNIYTHDLCSVRGSSVSIVTKLRAGQSRRYDTNSEKEQVIFLYTKISRRVLKKNKPPIRSVQGRFYCVVKWREREPDHSPLCSSKDKNEWRFTPKFPRASKSCRGITQPYVYYMLVYMYS